MKSLTTFNKPIISKQGLALVQARKDGTFSRELMKIPRHKRGRLRGEAIVYSLWEKKSKQRVITLKFPNKTWKITMEDSQQAWQFGVKLAGASHAGMWLPSKSRLTARDVIRVGSPSKRGTWYFLMWDSDAKTFIIQKHIVNSELELVPTRESTSVDAVDYSIPIESNKPKTSKDFPMKSRFQAKLKRNPFAMFELQAKNVVNLAHASPYNIARNPSKDYSGYVFSKQILFEDILSKGSKESMNYTKLFNKATDKGTELIINLQGKIPDIRDEFKKKQKAKKKKTLEDRFNELKFEEEVEEYGNEYDI